MKQKLYFFWCLLFLITMNSYGQSEEITALIKDLPQMKEDVNKIEALDKISLQLIRTLHVDSAFVFIEKLSNLSKKLNYKKGALMSYSNYAKGYAVKNEFDKALQQINLLLDEAELAQDNRSFSEGYSMKGRILFYQKAYVEALNALYKSIPYSEDIKNYKTLSITYYEISQILRKQKKNEEARSVLNKARVYARQLESDYLLKTIEFQLGIVFNELDIQLDSALIFFEGYKDYLNEYGNKQNAIYALSNIGKVYQKQKKYDKAKTNYLKALPSAKTFPDKAVVLNLYKGLQEVAIEEQQLSKSLALGKESLIHHSNFYEEQAIILYNMAFAANQLNDFQNAYQYQQQYIAQNDSLNHQLRAVELEELEQIYQTKEQQLQIKSLEKQNQLQELRETNYLIVFVLIISVLVFVLLIYRYTRQKNMLLRKEIANKSEIAKKTELLAAQAVELKQLDQLKSKFFANISHELRTPLTLILNPINHILKKNNLPSEVLKLLHVAEYNGMQLKDSINQIMDLIKLETGTIEVHQHDFNLAEWFYRISENFELQAASQDITYNYKFKGDSKLYVIMDMQKLSTIIKNLLANAFKFTSNKGTVHFNLEVLENNLLLEVSDTGRGIHTLDIPSVFDRYYQTKLPNAPIEGGAGIGLALCKELVELMNGTISVDSKWEKGSTFSVLLPKIVSTAPVVNNSIIHNDKVVPTFKNIPPNKNLIKEVASSLPKILVVEDHLDICTYLENILSTEYTVQIANNGQAALAILKELDENHLPQLIISDIMMPVMDGFQFIEQLKNTPAFRYIPVIMLTARAEMADKIKALRIGIDDYLVKPFNEEELFARIDNILQRVQVISAYQQMSLTEEEPKDNVINSNGVPTKLLEEDKLWLADLEAFVEGKLGDFNLSTDSIALEMTVSKSTLFRKMNSLLGLTPMQYVKELRMVKALQFLEVGKYSTIKAVSYAVGFKESKNFTRNFKKRFGKHPKEYFTVFI